MSTPNDAGRLDAEALYALYEAHREDDPRAGVTAFEQICLDNQRWGLAYDLLARLLEAAGEDERAYEAFRTGMDIGLRSRRLGRELKADLVLKVINFCLRRGWERRARTHLQDLVDFAPRHPLVAALRARMAEGDASAVVADHVSKRREVQGLLRRARDAFEGAAYDEARALYHRALERDDRCTNAYIFLAQTYAQLPQAQRAEGVRFYEQLAEAQPGWGLGLNLLGQLYEAAGRLEDAYTVLERAAELSDTSPTLDVARKVDLRLRLADFCDAHGWPARVEHQLARVARLAPDHPRVADRAPPDDTDALLAPARAADAPAERLRLYAEVIERAPRCRAAYVELASLCRAEADHLEDGLDVFEQVVARAPRWGLAWKLLGQLHTDAGNDERAYDALHRATDLGLQSDRLSDQLKADNLLALVDFCNQRQWYDRALEHVERLLELQPDHPAGRALRGLLVLQVDRD
ncbi:MAG: hypothetical protein H6704_12010 [Myxococcales bacterium]|nr:hypothetical protein [Myxococcales bacterium]